MQYKSQLTILGHPRFKKPSKGQPHMWISGIQILDVILMATPAPNFGNFYRSGKRIQRSGKRTKDLEIQSTSMIGKLSLKDIIIKCML